MKLGRLSFTCFVPFTFFLSGCLTTLSAPGPGVSTAPLVPTLAVPAPGWHWQVAATGAAVEPGDYSSVSGYAEALSGGALWQTEMNSGWGWGGFGSLQGRLMFSQIEGSASGASGTLTQAQINTLNSKSADFETGVEGRAGLIGRVPIGAAAVYVRALGQYETGSYFDYRRSADGIGEYYNFADSPWTPGLGWGVDLSTGSAGKWSAGLLGEVTYLSNHSQSYVGQSGGIVYVRSGGETNWSAAITLGGHLEFQQVQVIYTWTYNTSANEGLTLVYRW